MAFGSFQAGSNNQPMAEINVIPLVDIMLVLLVIFIITAPLMTHAVKVELPRAESEANVVKTENVQLSIDDKGAVFWNGEKVSPARLADRMRETAALAAHSEIHIHADRNARYETIAQVMSEAAKNGLTKIGFVTLPPTRR